MSDKEDDCEGMPPLMEESDNSEEELPVDGKVGFLVVRKVLAARAIEEDDMQR